MVSEASSRGKPRPKCQTLSIVAGTSWANAPAPRALERDFDEKLDVIFRAVHREFANPRAGTASTRKRDEVAGGGRKPWRQKGTGRARQGSIRSPQWRHGGVVFGPQPRSYVEGLNKKERRLAFLAALADRFRNDAVTVFDASDFGIEKTAAFAKLIFGSAKAARTRPDHARRLRYRGRRTATRSRASAATCSVSP